MKNRKIINVFIISFLMFFISLNNINANTFNILATNFCQREEIARVIGYIDFFIKIIRVAVPIVLIISAMIKLTNAITKNDGLDSVKKVLVVNVVAAILIFLIPSFINIITKITGTYDSYENCIKLSKNPIKTNPVNPINNGEGASNDGSPSIASITHKGSFVVVNAQKGTSGNIAGYYFTTSSTKPNGKEDTWVVKDTTRLEIAKLPGTYYVYVKDSQNKISLPAKLNITWEELLKDGPRSRDDSFAPIPNNIDSVLKQKSDSKEKLDDFIAWSVKSAGLFTKEGVATAAISAANYLHAKHNLHISYISNRFCFNQRYNVNFGSNPDWGKPIGYNDIQEKSTDSNGTIYPRQIAQREGILKYCEGNYGGLDCQSFVGWSIHNGGFKANNTHGSYVGKNKATESSVNKSGDFARAVSLYDSLIMGDIMVNPHHVMLFLAHYDENNDGKKDGVYVYEMYTRVGMRKWSYQELYNKEKYYNVKHMSGYYSNSNNYACLQNSKGNIVEIPNAWKDKSSLFKSNCKA